MDGLAKFFVLLAGMCFVLLGFLSSFFGNKETQSRSKGINIGFDMHSHSYSSPEYSRLDKKLTHQHKRTKLYERLAQVFSILFMVGVGLFFFALLQIWPEIFE